MMPHVLVVRLDNLGDVLLAGPAVRAVAASAREVTMLCGPRGRASAEILPGVDQIVAHRAAWIDPDPGQVARGDIDALVDQLAALEIDQAIVLTSFHQSALPTALILRMAGVPVVVAESEDYPGSLLDVRHHTSDELHEVERALSLVETLGYQLPPDDDGRLAVTPVDPDANPVRDLRPYVVVHPGASVPARAWPAHRHASLVEALVADGRRVVVTGAPGEAPLTARVVGPGGDGAVDLTGAVDWKGLAAVLADADVLVAGNTGPAHLSAAVGTPVVSLFAPTVPAGWWRPWGVPHVLLGRQNIGCAGCRARTCPVPGHPCIGDVEVPEVLAAVDAMAGVGLTAGR